ncbi:hypothetical protein [Micromonospora sp. ATA51]|uniref:hypothetical protein n=1 Tax=Micromonospora sp. ATA51 TaxID=2806098 RepID=UPI001A4E9523|nr:hypothetical protein [Micromonospora sp. ATA51]MBM0226123.1 hypothetical protein [Micromonospora sp. ATA51]
MTNPVVDWSPADHPEAIAVSEIQWWERAAALALLRMHDSDDHRISWFSSRQIDARQLILALRQLLAAVPLVDGRLQELGLDQALNALRQAKQEYEQALPGLTEVRNALMHFEAWALGAGHGPQKRRVAGGAPAREVASEFWGFAYDPAIETISLGPYTISVNAVAGAVARLADAVYAAARAVAHRNAVDLGADAKKVLTAEGVSTDEVSSFPRLIVGSDNRLWLSLSLDGHDEEAERRALADRVVRALHAANIKLICPEPPNERDVAGPLARGGALLCERAPR